MQEICFQEDFDGWNREKQKLHNRKDINSFYIQPRQIWYVKLWLNIWFEQNGKRSFQRPVLVIQRIWILFFVVPLSTKDKANPYYYKLKSTSFDKSSLTILSQVRMLDKRRFINPIGFVNEAEFCAIKKLLKDIYLTGV